MSKERNWFTHPTRRTTWILTFIGTVGVGLLLAVNWEGGLSTPIKGLIIGAIAALVRIWSKVERKQPNQNEG